VSNVYDLRSMAKRFTPRAVFDYTDGAAGNDSSLRAARRAFEQIEFVPRILRDVSQIDTQTDFLGTPSTIPVALGPTGFTRMMHYQGELAVAQAARKKGVPYALSTLGTTSVEDLKAIVPDDKQWFQLYLWKDREASKELLGRVKAAGYSTLILTVDTAVAGLRHRDVRNGLNIPPKLTATTMLNMARYPRWWMNLLSTQPLEFASFRDTGGTVSDLIARVFDPSITPEDVEWLRGEWDGPLVVKGIQSLEDAKLVSDLGVNGIILSNHGGRQVERGLPPITLLPEVAQALGEKTSVFVDSGIMSGADVVAALCLGAKGTFIGRAYLYGLMAAGESGVEKTIDIFAKEIATTMALIGATSVEELGPQFLRTSRK
jgi:L-lactate dehydrogenase (cytochrome)